MRVTSKYTEGIGERIRTVRRRARINQAELGEKLGVSRQMTNGYENERMVPPIYMIEKMSNLFGVTPWWLLYGVGSPSPKSGGAGTIPGRTYSGSAGDELSDAQQTLINYILADKAAAEKLAKELLGRWDKSQFK